MTQHVFALDFDGVLCDSAAETAVAAWRTGARLWPQWRGNEPPPGHEARFVRLRPVIETGYQAVLLMRAVDAGLGDETIQLRFPELCSGFLDSLGLSRDELARLFGAARDAWIQEDLSGWLGRHRFYPGVLEAFSRRAQSDPVFILTTKQERFVSSLLRSRGVDLPPDRVFGWDARKPKEEVLGELSRQPAFHGAPIHFVEDRLETLLRVARIPELAHVLLYLVDWGYNTASERERARQFPRARIWSLSEFLNV